MDGIASNATAPKRRVAVTYGPSGPADVDTRVAYDWLVPDATGAKEIALQAAASSSKTRSAPSASRGPAPAASSAP